MVDVLVLGSGPAGLSAAATLRMRGKDVLVLSHQEEQSNLRYAKQVDNYPGVFPVSGAALLTRMYEQAKALGARFQTGTVMKVAPRRGGFSVLCGAEVVEARCVILALGAAKPRLLENEEKMLGNGVSYCGTCDGMLYRGKSVVCYAETREGAEEVNFLATLCSRVRCIAADDLSGVLNQQVERIPGKPMAIMGTEYAEGLKTDIAEYPADGVFLFRKSVALSTLMAGLLTDGGAIRVARDMATSRPGVFACGDIAGQPYQAAKAVGEGNIAALSCVTYIDAMMKDEE